MLERTKILEAMTTAWLPLMDKVLRDIVSLLLLSISGSNLYYGLDIQAWSPDISGRKVYDNEGPEG